MSTARQQAPAQLTALDQLSNTLAERLGESLAAVILSGDLVKPDEFTLQSSTIDVMVVLNDASVETLGKMADPVARAERKLRLNLLILTRNDLRNSCDVFPIRFLDVQAYHELLWGEDVLADLEISNEHLRLRCEQELRNLKLRLRNLLIHRLREPRLLRQTLFTAAHTLVRALSACVVLRTGVLPVGDAAVMDGVAAELGCDRGALDEVIELKHGTAARDLEALTGAYGRFLATVERAVTVVDAVDSEGAS